MKNQNVGIITFHASLNYGSALQAFALQQVLGDAGYTAKIIDFILPRDMRQYRLFQTHIYCIHPKAMLRDVLYFSDNVQRKKRFKAFTQEHLPLTTPTLYAGKSKSALDALNEEFDAFICGSDQIWNLGCTGSFVPEFFLTFAQDTKTTVAYAPSMPTTVEEQYYPQLRESIARLDAVSVREQQTVQYLQETVGVDRPIAHTVDPTLLLDADDYITRFHLGEKKQKHIFVYLLGDKEPALIALAKQTAAKTGLPIKYVYTQKLPELKGAEFALNMGPDDFLQAIYDAAYVITNSFHATVFSVHFHKPFCVFARQGSSSRMVELLGRLGLEKNLYTPENEVWMQSHADEATDEKRRQLAASSRAFLFGALQEND